MVVDCKALIKFEFAVGEIYSRNQSKNCIFEPLVLVFSA